MSELGGLDVYCYWEGVGQGNWRWWGFGKWGVFLPLFSACMDNRVRELHIFSLWSHNLMQHFNPWTAAFHDYRTRQIWHLKWRTLKIFVVARMPLEVPSAICNGFRTRIKRIHCMVIWDAYRTRQKKITLITHQWWLLINKAVGCFPEEVAS